VDIAYLKVLVQYGHKEIKNDCIFVGPANGRKPFCGIPLYLFIERPFFFVVI
jgi:hypothetical protein